MSGYTYDIKTSKKDNGSTISLSACHVIYSIINLFLSTFLVAHIHSLTDNIYDYAIKVGLYQIVTYAVMTISYFLFSLWVDKSNRIWCYRVANLFSTALVVITVFWGDKLAQLVVLAGALNGLTHGAYYASYNVLKQEMVSRNSMDNYAVIISVIGKIVSVVFPLVLGALLSVSSISQVAIYVLVLSAILFGVTFFVKAKRPAESGFSIKEYIGDLKARPKVAKKIKFIYIICCFYGFTSVLSMLLTMNIMSMEGLGSTFSLGIVTSVCSGLSIVLLLLVGRFTKCGKRIWLFVVSALLPILGVVLFITLPNMYTLIAYNVCIAVGDSINATILDIYRNKNLKEAGLYQGIAEHQCIVESIFGVIRCISFGLLIGMGASKSKLLLDIGFVVFVALYSMTSVLLMIYEKKDTQEKQKEKMEKVVVSKWAGRIDRRNKQCRKIAK